MKKNIFFYFFPQISCEVAAAYLATLLNELTEAVKCVEYVFKTKCFLILAVAYCHFVRQFVNTTQLFFQLSHVLFGVL